MEHSQKGFINAVEAAYYNIDGDVSVKEFKKICKDLLRKASLYKEQVFIIISKLLCEEYGKSLVLGGTKSQIFYDANISAYLRLHIEYQVVS